MATTSNTITATAGQTEFSFSFPYLKKESIKVTIDTVATTAFTIPDNNPTTVILDSGATAGQVIKILRLTSTEATPATFFSGGAIRSQDLNNNFDSILFITQEKENELTEVIAGGIADGSITSSKLADQSVGTAALIDGGVATVDLADNAVTTAKIADANVTTAKILDANITTAKILDNAVTTGKLASNAVTTAKILDANVTTAKILDANITTAKILDNAVTTAKILDANVTTAKILDNAVTTGKLASNAVTTSKIVDGNVTTDKIASNAVTTNKIADDAVTVGKLEFTDTNDRFYLAGNSTDEIVLWIGRNITGTYTGNDHGLRCHSGSSGTSYTQLMGRNSTSDSYILRGRVNDTDRIRIASDGDVTNNNNSYAGISDAKLKENIVDAPSQWDDVKATKVRNFNFKEETGYSTEKQIGWVAQEVELVSPGCVKTETDIDNDGNPLETSTKLVKTSVLLIKAYKALQEAMERIEALEAQVITLTSQIN